MSNRLLGFFSGFPNRSFPLEVAEKLREGLPHRSLLVFVSAWPDEFGRNDEDSAGMHGMFAEYDIAFDKHCVIDERMESLQAAELIGLASCIFLMGGHPAKQLKLMRSKGLDKAIINSPGMVLGVSAGAINMAKHSLDTKESPLFYPGLALADITVKPHFEPENPQMLAELMQVSRTLPIYAMEDDSSIFVKNGDITHTGRIHYISGGRVSVF
ncbi:MAG: type 1 glutamine amidotransferase-like domain-containing protein [Eubacteriaceae bacterium]|nr:type 1 glutamine amidotransferase-like domain-containing protein [Eubacteriaceae bacterium]